MKQKMGNGVGRESVRHHEDDDGRRAHRHARPPSSPVPHSAHGKKPWEDASRRAVQSTRQLLFFFFFFVRSAARVACSKTSRTPSLVLAEHSRYLYASIFLATSSPWTSGERQPCLLDGRQPSGTAAKGERIRRREGEASKTGQQRRTCSVDTGFCEVLCNSSMVFGSYRRSFLQPTRMMGSPWQKWRTSEIHYAARQHMPPCPTRPPADGRPARTFS